MVPLLRSEIFRLSRWSTPRVLLIILAPVVLVTYLALWSTVQMPQSSNVGNIGDLKDSLRINSVPTMGLSIVHQVGTVLLVILAATTIASEFSLGTIRTVLPRASGRASFLGAKLLGVVLFCIVLVTTGFLIALAGSALVTVLAGLNASVSPDFAIRSVGSIGRTVYVILPYVALAFLVALVTRSSGAGIGVGLGVYFLESVATTLLMNTPVHNILQVLPGLNVMALLQDNTTDTAASAIALPDPWQAAVVIALYTSCFLAVAFWHFRTRDITVGSAG